jgi:hypothetical protein
MELLIFISIVFVGITIPALVFYIQEKNAPMEGHSAN